MEEAVAPTFSGKKTGDAATSKMEKWIMHYSSAHSILLVGEGNFSFSACLARAFGSAENMVATSHDTEDDLMKKHSDAAIHLDELKRLGCKVMHGIGVKNMHEDCFLKTERFDRIIFNFPHSGHDDLLREGDDRLIEKHKALVCDFFRSAKWLLREDGEVHVTHRVDQPYDQWDITSLAKKWGMLLKEKVRFDKEYYPGYENKRGGGIMSNKAFPIRNNSSTYKFSLKKGDEDEGLTASVPNSVG